MKVEVSVQYAQRAYEALNDAPMLRKIMTQVASNVFEFDEGEDDDIDDILDCVVASLEVLPEGEYVVEL